jgi:uncharacterized protein YjbI with pentapeptide repeats
MNPIRPEPLVPNAIDVGVSSSAANLEGADLHGADLRRGLQRPAAVTFLRCSAHAATS